jgi:hypothetical protein
MAKTKVSEWSNISDNNLDVGGINISDDMPPSFVNDGMREIMAQIKQWQSGQYAEPMTITGDLDIKGGLKLNSSAGTSGQFLMSKGDGVTPQWGSAEIPDAFAPGMIILWSGTTATIPTGWALCNGGSGTPNLVDRFIVGAGNAYPVGSTGGTADATIVSHNHTVSSTSANAGNHAHSISGSTGGAGTHSHTSNQPYTNIPKGGGGGTIFPEYTVGSSKSLPSSTIGNHTHSVSGSTSTTGNHKHTITSICSSSGTSATNKNLPPYYALAYIMRL